MIIAVVSVTLMSAIAKLIGPEYNPIQIAFIRGIIVIILLLPIINKLGGLKFLYTKKPFLHFFRSIAGVIGNIFFLSKTKNKLLKVLYNHQEYQLLNFDNSVYLNHFEFKTI